MICRAGSSRIEWEKTAAMVVAYERPDYFRQVVASFESNPEAEELPFWFFLDHSPTDEGRQVEKIANSCSIRDKTIVRRGENLGTGRNIIDGLRTLFDQERYDRLVVFEDDLIVNPQYIGLTLYLSDRFHRYANVGTVQAHAKDRRGRDAQHECVRRLRLTRQNFWGYCMTRQVWDSIKPYMYAYEERFLDGIESYSERDHMRIRKWMQSLLSSAPRTPTGEALLEVPGRFVPPFQRRVVMGHLDGLLRMATGNAYRALRWSWRLRPSPTGQDAVMNMALYLEGLHRVTTSVPRTRYIGESGEHSNRAHYAQRGWPESRTSEWVEDEVPGDFRFPWES